MLRVEGGGRDNQPSAEHLKKNAYPDINARKFRVYGLHAINLESIDDPGSPGSLRGLAGQL